MRIDSIRLKLRINNIFTLVEKNIQNESEKNYMENIRKIIMNEITNEEQLTKFENKANKKPRIKIKLWN